MASTSSITTAMSTMTNPMTTLFTPPSSCSTHWTYEQQAANSVTGGLLLQDAAYQKGDRSCLPTGFAGWGRAPAFIQVFSPGACPVGYTTAADLGYGGGTTTAVCCLSDFGYTSFISSVNAGNKTAEYYGCTSIYPGSAGSTAVFAEVSTDGFISELDGTTTAFTSVSGPVTMWAQPITVMFQGKDRALFTTSTSAAAASTPTTTSPASTAATSSASTTAASSASTTSASPSTAIISSASTPSPSLGLSVGAIAGIVIGAAAVIAIVIGAAIFFRRKKQSTPPATHGNDVSQSQMGPEYWRPNPGMYNAKPHYQFAEPVYEVPEHSKQDVWHDRRKNQIAFGELPNQRDPSELQ